MATSVLFMPTERRFSEISAAVSFIPEISIGYQIDITISSPFGASTTVSSSTSSIPASSNS